ncbi:MAG: Uma2 family endonuclease [Acidobacteria bacterium]|nr:Uma2 family endonuclease [Acidobacteriota bacterium]
MARSLSIDCDPTTSTTLDVKSLRLTDDQFLRLCADNRDFRFELTAEGELIIMPLPGSKTGWREGKVFQRLANWTERDATGICFGPDTGFKLPNGATRGPDAAWMPLDAWKRFTAEQQEKLVAVCPYFVVEVRSPSDALAQLQEKMQEYKENGARLGWLLDPFEKRVYLYRPGRDAECVENPGNLSGEDVLPGFQFNFQEILEV